MIFVSFFCNAGAGFQEVDDVANRHLVEKYEQELLQEKEKEASEASLLMEKEHKAAEALILMRQGVWVMHDCTLNADFSISSNRN